MVRTSIYEFVRDIIQPKRATEREKGWGRGMKKKETGRGKGGRDGERRRHAGLLVGGLYILLLGRTVLQEQVWVVPSESYEGASVPVNIFKQ